jgi:hypothetical protein
MVQETWLVQETMNGTGNLDGSGDHESVVETLSHPNLELIRKPQKKKETLDTQEFCNYLRYSGNVA